MAGDGWMAFFDPYITFRVMLALFIGTYLLFDFVAMFILYLQLPRFVRRIILLKLLQLRSRSLRIEISLVVLLLSVEGWLLFRILTGEN